MKKRSLVSLLLASALSVSLLAACNKDDDNKDGPSPTPQPQPQPTQPVKLSAPTISREENVISWSAVDNATGYDVYEGTTVVSEAQTELSYTINKTEVGTYTYTVKAVSTDDKYTTSDASNSVEYKVTSSEPAPTEDTSTKLTGKIYLVGDSTVCSFNDSYYLPRYGYGTQLYNYINCDESQIVNLALSGRSSLSYLLETDENHAKDPNTYKNNYSQLIQNISAGDYLIIGFGHNDEKSNEPARYTDPTKSYTDESKTNGPSFQYTLYENYIKVAKEAGATPILCTPIVRYDANGGYTGAKVHNTDKGDYAAAIKTLGTATNTTVIDLTELTKEEYKKDNAAAIKFHAHTTYKLNGETKTPDGRDDTHINKYGAKMVAYKFAQAILASDCTLKANVITTSTAPTEADYTAAIKTDYVKPPVQAFDPANTTATKLNEDNWFATIMGDVGGTKNFPHYTVSYENDKFTVGNHGDTSGKFANASDGFGAAFIQVDKTKDFTASASVKVISKSASANNQTGFGMMLRDDIFINKSDNSIASNYVTAGALGDGSSVLFNRESGTLTKPSNTTTVAVNSTYTVSIKRVGQTVNVSFDDGTHVYKQTFTDFDFVAADNDYMYLCLFANRGLVVEFSDVQFTIDGDAQGA
ncbi:MAG: hypothetical protein K2G38_02035 [Clostridia bacterium]|nr:hypothetical protein [Clostridia bacterium]